MAAFLPLMRLGSFDSPKQKNWNFGLDGKQRLLAKVHVYQHTDKTMFEYNLLNFARIISVCVR